MALPAAVQLETVMRYILFLNPGQCIYVIFFYPVQNAFLSIYQDLCKIKKK